MKTKTLLLTILCALALNIQAGITTYTFKSVSWTSDPAGGWVCDKEASAYDAGRIYADGTLHSAGVSVKTSSSGAGATSVLSFTDIRRIIVNFCQNASDGRGVIYMQVGENEPDSIIVTKPVESGTGHANRDSVFFFTTPKTGKIKFWVTCTHNAININSISIRSASGESPVFTQDSYQLVTNINQLQDSDQIIIGVCKEGVNKIMGYFDEGVSQNNIHAITGKYSADRTTVAANDNAIYTLRTAELDGHPGFIIQDEVRYEEAYLVASGGKTKNRLALWTSVYDPNTYGYYGLWDISIATDGAATIKSLGNSEGKYIRYNATNNPPLFGCYDDPSKQTNVAIYRLTTAPGNVAAIVAPLTNFGTVILKNGTAAGSKTIEVNANKLTQDISATLKHGDIFSLSTNTLDRDGDNLTISYNATAPGKYIDTLLLQSDTVSCEATIILNVAKLSTIAEVVEQPDYTMVYLNEVEVTKKYDMYVFIRDETGSMLIWDNNNAYGQGLKSGDKLTNVCGRYQNYYGVPELAPTAGISTYCPMVRNKRRSGRTRSSNTSY